MINFHDREDLGPSVVSVLSIVVILGALGFMLFAKPPTPLEIQKQVTSDQLKYKKEAKEAAVTAAQSQKPIDNLTWTGGPEVVQTAALELATSMAQKRGIKLTVVRTQRATLVDNLVSLPYVITVEGSFLGTLEFARDFEDTKNKFALSQIQISSSDPNSDNVTANIGIVAYVNPKEALPADTGSSTVQSRLDSAAPGGLPPLDRPIASVNKHA